MARLETAVGRTVLKGCPVLEPRCADKIVRNDREKEEGYASSAYYFSACPLVVAGDMAAQIVCNSLGTE